MQKHIKHTIVVTVFLLSLTLSSTSIAGSIPPDPTNAALLYYQALMTMPIPEGEVIDQLDKAAKGEIEPDQIRTFLQNDDNCIEFVEAAVGLSQCDWGYRFSLGLDVQLPQMWQLRRLSYILAADARLHAFDGEYRQALERCQLIDSLSRHVGDDTLISYLVSLAIRELAMKCVQDIIGQIADDAECLQALRHELTMAAPLTVSPIEPLKIEVEIMADLMQVDKRNKMIEAMGIGLDNDAPQGVEDIVDDLEKERKAFIASLDAKTLKQARTIYRERIAAMLTTLNTPMPYAEKYQRLKKLSTDFNQDDPASRVAGAFTGNMANVYTIRVRNDTHANALLAGLDICLQRAESGKLSTTLPEGLPKDPFSGQDFQYELTDKGFTLRCQTKDPVKDIVHEYAFTVK